MPLAEGLEALEETLRSDPRQVASGASSTGRGKGCELTRFVTRHWLNSMWLISWRRLRVERCARNRDAFLYCSQL